MRTPQRQWGSFDSRANWNAADANDDGAGAGITCREGREDKEQEGVLQVSM